MPEGGTILILGGAGMVGLPVAREACRAVSARISPDRFIAGDVVGWLLTNEIDQLGMTGHRLF